jgi:voltage-gated potassium channel
VIFLHLIRQRNIARSQIWIGSTHLIQHLKNRTWEILEQASGDDRTSRIVDLMLMILILLNILTVIIESDESIYFEYQPLFDVFDFFSVSVFGVEYILRVWACTQSLDFGHSGAEKRFRFIFSFNAIVDLIAIMPSILQFFIPSLDLRILRALRLMRIFKFTRYSTALDDLIAVLYEQRRAFLAIFFIISIALVFASAGIYIAERDAQPENFGSIPKSMWWAVATLTTVGYGDITPVTLAGKIFGTLMCLLGIGTVALPSGILASAFSEQLSRRKDEFKAKLEEALDDGVITNDEEDMLTELREKLNLNESQVEALRDKLERDKLTI